MARTFVTLPSDLVNNIMDFLSGFDLVRLSHVKSALLTDLLEPNSNVWKMRLQAHGEASNASAKQQHCTMRSLRFEGLTYGACGHDERGGAVNLPFQVASLCGRSSFSISLAFALSKAPVNGFNGGILLGAQSIRFTDQWWAHYHLQFIHVDLEGNLYC